MNFPEQLKYTKEHEWIAIEGNVATVGITEFAQGELGDIIYVDIDTIGKELSAEVVFGSVEAVKTVSDLFLPVSGTLIEKNPLLDSQPELVNKDPYGDGWMIKMTIQDPSQLDSLLSVDAYKALIGS
ncbi:MAG: glycine cleavage system protein H [Chitinophagaceae bacterium]|jgi:glycine cleavage system H protein|nr:MAG: glycine cleavage system protein H [Chitinophagaceae bacterium]